jgi:CHASE3 domain sensor protein
MRLGLTGRILICGGLVLVFLLAEFALVVHSFRSVRHSTHSEQRAEATVVAGVRAENLVLQLESGSRGYVITHDPGFLQPWRQAQRDLPGQSRLLMSLAPGAWTDQFDRDWRAYVRDWSKPLVQLARTSPRLAAVRVSEGEGKRRIVAIRRLIEPRLQEMDGLASRDRAAVADAQTDGIEVGVVGILVTVLLFVWVVGYFLRTAVLPIRRIALATQQVAHGAFGVEVPEKGAGEVGQLATAFNEMSRSLSGHQRELAD